MSKKILIIRMMTLADVISIGVPALRHYQQKYLDAEITFLTHDQGAEIADLVDKRIKVQLLPNGTWPDNILPAMESFLGLAEDIVRIGYDEIICLDTHFMPCFLARFLKDAGENVIGNTMNKSVQDLITEFQTQTLKPEYVSDAREYLESSFFTMVSWHTQWWQTSPAEKGYGEYYLAKACGLTNFTYDNHIDVEPAISLNEVKSDKKIIALATQTTGQEQGYPFTKQLKWALEDLGYHVVSSFNSSTPIKQQLALLKQADLAVTTANASLWLAKAVACPTLTLAGDLPPVTLMADYTIENSSLSEVEVASLVDSIKEIVPLS
ncbi:hypothetical protein HR060_00765 [Catenovulum sp. SM1970]|uniref:glycosyltransferase family 9 protein n=1 Tax=Marinifaba aquimaris TaxID=2741323 RepID=UPI001572A0A7|nr:hypothetical protein [Marinifaba aquimaris]NTS75381.1 hypothetical protein [Marinifaba aquimaris]